MELGIPCGGWCPAGRRSESGPISRVYPLIEASSSFYPQRTRMNVRDSDATLIICSGPPSGGTLLTLELANQKKRPCLVLDLSSLPHPVFDHLPPQKILGGRHSRAPSTRVQRVGEGARRAGEGGGGVKSAHIGRVPPFIEKLESPFGLSLKTCRPRMAACPVFARMAKFFRAWLKKIRPCVLNIAGSRESEAPGIHRLSFSFLREILGEMDLDDPLRAEALWPPPRPATRLFDFDEPSPQEETTDE